MGETTNHQWENVYIQGGEGERSKRKKGKSTGKMKHVLDATSYHLPRWKWKISLKSLIWGGVCVVFEDERRRTKSLNEWTVLKIYGKKNKEKFLEKPNLYNSPFLIRFPFTSIPIASAHPQRSLMCTRHVHIFSLNTSFVLRPPSHPNRFVCAHQPVGRTYGLVIRKKMATHSMSSMYSS